MVTLICPWCEADVAVDLELMDGEFICPDCSTSCVLEEDPREPVLAAAA